MLALGAILVAVALWSLLPLIVHSVADSSTYPALLLFSQIFGALGCFFLLLIRTRGRFPKDMIIRISKNYRLMVLTAILIGLHNLALYYGFATSQVALVIFLAELWPLFAILLAPLVLWKPRKSLGYLDWLAISIAVAGAVGISILSSGTAKAIPDPLLLLMLFQALANALVSLLLPKIANEASSTNPIDAILLSQAICRLLSLPIIGLWVIALGSPLSTSTLGAGAFIGLFVVAIGSSAFSYALLTSQSFAIAAMWWITPLLSLTWIVIFTKASLTPIAVLAGAAILIANLLLQLPYRYSLASIGTQVYLILACYLVLFTGPIHAGHDDLIMWEISAVAFTIISGILYQKIDREESNAGKEFQRICKCLCTIRDLAARSTDLEKARYFENQTALIFYRLVEYDNHGTELPELDAWEKLQLALNELERSIIKQELSTNGAQLIADLRDSVQTWGVSRRDKLSGTQTLITAALALTTSLGVLLSRPDHPVGRIGAVLLTASFIYAALRLIDHNLGNRSLSAESICEKQLPFTNDRNLLYIPSWVLDSGHLIPPSRRFVVRSFRDDKNGFSKIELKASNVLVRHLSSAVLLLILLVFLALVWNK